MLSIFKLDKKNKQTNQLLNLNWLFPTNLCYEEHGSISEHLLSFCYRVSAAGTKLIVKGLQYYGKVKTFLDTWLQDIVSLLL